MLIDAWTIIAGPKGMTPAQIAFWDSALVRTMQSEEWIRLRRGRIDALFLPTQFCLRQEL